MNTELTAQPETAAPTAIRRRSLWVGAVTTIVGVAGVLWAVLKSSTADSSETSSLPYVAAVAVIVGVVLFAWLVPNRVAARSTGLTLAIISVPLLYAFWSALPLLVAVAAIVIATAYRPANGARRGRRLAALIVAVPVALVTLLAILVG